MMRCLLALLALFVAACSAPEELRLAFAIRVPLDGGPGPLDNDPLLGGERLELRAFRRGDETPLALEEWALPAESFQLPPLPLGGPFSLEARIYSGDVLLARGRSFVFDVTEDGVVSPHAADLFIGALGRFGRRLGAALPSRTLALVPTADGALGGLEDGRLFVFRAHAPEPLELLDVGLPAGTRFVAGGDARLFAFDAVAGRLELFAPGGEREASLTLDEHGPGVALHADARGERLLLVGGGPSGEGRAVTLVTCADGSAVSRPLPALAAPRGDASIAWVEGGEPGEERAVVLGGHAGGLSAPLASLVDPSGVEPVRDIPAPPALEGATVTGIGAGQLLLVGGPAIDDVRLVILELSPVPSLIVALPAPVPLSVHRSAPQLVRLAERVLLVVGGQGDDGELVAHTELLDLRVFPGSSASSGALPVTTRAPFGGRLADGAVWVFADDGVYAYEPPLDPLTP